MVSKADKFQESLEALDLQGLILVIGLLSQRALELTLKEKPKDVIIKPTFDVTQSLKQSGLGGS